MNALDTSAYYNPKNKNAIFNFFADTLKENGTSVFRVKVNNYNNNIPVNYSMLNKKRIFCIPAKAFSHINFKNKDTTHKIKKMELENACISLPSNELKWAFEFVPQNKILKVYIPDSDVYKKNHLSINDFNYGNNLFFMDYDLSFLSKETNNVTSNDTRLWYKTGININEYMVRASGYTGNSGGRSAEFYVMKDFDSILSTAAVGRRNLYSEVISDSFYGMSLFNNKWLYSSVNQNNDSWINGVAQSNSTVKVYQGERLLIETRVLSGDFKIRRPEQAQFGELRVVVESDNNEIDEFYVGSTGNQFVEQGVIDYKFNIGKLIKNENEFIDTSAMLGLTNNIKLSSRAFYSKSDKFIQLSPSITGDTGSINVSYIHAKKNGGSYGLSRISARLNSKSNVFGINLYASSRFYLYKDDILNNYEPSSYISASKRLFQNSSVSVGYRKSSNSYAYNASYSTRFYDNKIQLSLSAERKDNDDVSFFARLSIPMSFGGSTRSTLSSQGSLIDARIEYMNRVDNLSYFIGTGIGETESKRNMNFSANYNMNDNAHLYTRASFYKNRKRTLVGGRGKIIASNEGFFWGKDRIGTGVIIIGNEDSVVGNSTIDSKGFLIQGVSPYKKKRIKMYEKSSFLNSSEEQSVSLRNGAISIIRPKFKKMYPYVYKFSAINGEKLTFMSTIYASDGLEVGYVANNGLAVFNHAQRSDKFKIVDPKGVSCWTDEITSTNIDNESIMQIACK